MIFEFRSDDIFADRMNSHLCFLKCPTNRLDIIEKVSRIVRAGAGPVILEKHFENIEEVSKFDQTQQEQQRQRQFFWARAWVTLLSVFLCFVVSLDHTVCRS